MHELTEPRYGIGFSRRRPPTWFLVTVMIPVPLVFGLLFIVLSRPSSARLSDLCEEDFATVQALRSNGIRVVAEEIEPTFKPHLIVTVHHDRERRDYYVTGAVLRSTKYSRVSNLLSRFSKLKKLKLPHATVQEANRIAKRNPTLAVTR